jgi:hypothetical protein
VIDGCNLSKVDGINWVWGSLLCLPTRRVTTYEGQKTVNKLCLFQYDTTPACSRIDHTADVFFLAIFGMTTGGCEWQAKTFSGR